jgi:hypothetical protein
MEKIVLDNQGYWELDQISYQETDKPLPDGVDCEKWIKINHKDFLVKRKRDTDTYSRNNYLQEEIEKYNHILLPELFSQISLPHANYFLAKENGKEYFISPSFLAEGERVISGEEILPEEMKESGEDAYIQKRLQEIDQFVTQRGQKQISQTLQQEHLKQILISKLIGWDEFTPYNWGIIQNEAGQITRVQPLTDYAESCYGTQEDSYNLTQTGEDSIEAFLTEYSTLPEFWAWVKKIPNQINLEKAYESILRKKQNRVPIECQKHYQQFFNSKLQELQQAIRQIENEREEER